MARLANQIVLVTGGGSGAGAATSKALFQEGAKVAIAGRNAKKLELVGKEIQSLAPTDFADRFMTIPGDITKPQEVDHIINVVKQKFGDITILVNNAGTNIKERRMREISIESWHQLIDTNLNGAFYCMRAVLPAMIAKKEGLIININSVSGKRAYPLAGAAYAASKFGMSALASCLAGEELENNIRVSSIYPGEIDTPILDARPNPVTEEHRSKILKPEDIAQAVLYIACLPARVSIPELIIKPTFQSYF